MRWGVGSVLNPLVWCELISLRLGQATLPILPLPEVVLVEPGKLIWRVSLGPERSAYLSQKAPNYGQQYVAYVDASRFYSVWRRQSLLDPGDYQGCPRIENMPRDYKYSDAQRGFEHGAENPVPLADVGFDTRISFTNGITRTLWLIYNGAKAFPVSTDSEESARRLVRELGAAQNIICLEGPPNTDQKA